jgi:uncharacterized protein YhdP
MKLGTLDAWYKTLSPTQYELKTNWQYSGATLTSKMEWGGKKLMQMIGKVTVNDLGLLLGGFSDNKYLENGSGSISLGLSWPGSPFDLSWKVMSGLFKVDLRSMRFANLPKKMKSGLGLVKLVNLLSFQNSLPFVSLAKKGFYVSHLSFIGEQKKGVLSTSDFKLYSPTVNAQAQGYLDFIKKTIGMKLTLQPQVTGSLPVIAAIAGGPIVGILAYALNQVIEPLVGKATEMRYTITGKLDNPVVKKAHS